MGKRDRDELDRILHESEEMLNELDDLDGITEDSESHEHHSSHELANKRFRARSDADDVPFDGYAEFAVSEDEMEVTGSFYPPGEGQEPIDLERIREQLRELNVVAGIDWETIEETVLACNTEHKEATDVTVAMGTPPVDEIAPHLVLRPEAGTQYRFARNAEDRVDYRSASPFVLVKAGDVLARVQPKRAGTQGSTVRGRAVPYNTKKVTSPRPGENTELRGDTVVATRDGRLEQDESSFRVSEVLEITTDVDYSTGHVDFAGDVIIHGEIKDGFRVRSGGSVFCATTMDASEVVAEGDLTVKRGLIGRKTGTVRVGGNVSVRFIENCYVEAGGTVEVDVGIIHSAVYAGNRIEVGARGIIVGSEIHCQNGLAATQIGTETGKPTEIYCGTDFKVEQKLEWIRDKTFALAKKQHQVQSALERNEGDRSALDRSALEALQAKLRDAIRRMNESAQTLVFKLDRNEDATVRVRGSVAPGTYIEMCHVPHIVRQKRSRVEFHLDKTRGEIVEQTIKPEEALRRSSA